MGDLWKLVSMISKKVFKFSPICSSFHQTCFESKRKREVRVLLHVRCSGGSVNPEASGKATLNTSWDLFMEKNKDRHEQRIEGRHKTLCFFRQFNFSIHKTAYLSWRTTNSPVALILSSLALFCELAVIYIHTKPP